MLETGELLEDPLAELRGNPRSGVRRSNLQQIGARTSRLCSHGDLNSAVAGRVLQSIVEQVGKELIPGTPYLIAAPNSVSV
jgi:hypothetical protein